MHFRMLPDHQKHGLEKDIFLCQEWLKTCFEAFAHASRPPEKKIFFNVWSGRKRVLMHFRMLPDHQKHGLEKDIFYRQEWLKTCFDAFSHAYRPPETWP
jgi:hypothetical protein